MPYQLLQQLDWAVHLCHQNRVVEFDAVKISMHAIVPDTHSQ